MEVMGDKGVATEVDDIDLSRSTLQIEQKRIFLNLRENGRGRYLRIAEVTGNNRSTIIIPSSGLQQFRTLLDEFIESDHAVAQGQQAMLPDGAVNEFGGVGQDAKKKKKRNKKSGGGGGGGGGGGTATTPATGENGTNGAGENHADSFGKRVFVGNLSWTTQWQGLKDHFQQCGQVVRADVFTERSGRSRGCGIVEFAEVEQTAARMTYGRITGKDGHVDNEQH